MEGRLKLRFVLELCVVLTAKPFSSTVAPAAKLLPLSTMVWAWFAGTVTVPAMLGVAGVTVELAVGPAGKAVWVRVAVLAGTCVSVAVRVAVLAGLCVSVAVF
jgi:hypothetical protein